MAQTLGGAVCVELALSGGSGTGAGGCQSGKKGDVCNSLNNNNNF